MLIIMDSNFGSSNIVEEKIKRKNGEVFVRKWIKGRFLGKGGFAKVYEFTNVDSKKVYAAKIILKSSLTKKRAKQKLISEIKIHKSLSHKHVVGFEHYFEDSDCVYILLELCPNQSLNELLRRRKRLHELEVMYYTKQIVGCLEYLHKCRVIHRDLKLGNLFINENMEIKIGDFGLATKLDFDGERKRTICGTPNYIAPEVLAGKNGHSYEVDIWSLGVIIYTLIIGKPPFETSNVKSTYDKIRKNIYRFPDHVAISDEARDLISWILSAEPDKRPSLEDLKTHKFLAFDTPETLHPSLLACPPSANMIKSYLPSDFHVSIKAMPKRLQETAPAGGTREKLGEHAPMSAKGGKHEMLDDKPVDDDQPIETDVPIHAKKWIDYTSKYGLGYILSNGAVGVFFNDATKIILTQDGKSFSYYE